MMVVISISFSIKTIGDANNILNQGVEWIDCLL